MMISLCSLLFLAFSAQIPEEADLVAKYGDRLTPEARVYRSVAPGVVSIDVSVSLCVPRSNTS